MKIDEIIKVFGQGYELGRLVFPFCAKEVSDKLEDLVENSEKEEKEKYTFILRAYNYGLAKQRKLELEKPKKSQDKTQGRNR